MGNSSSNEQDLRKLFKSNLDTGKMRKNSFSYRKRPIFKSDIVKNLQNINENENVWKIYAIYSKDKE